MNCIPIGRLSDDNPIGTDRLGMAARFAGTVNGMQRFVVSRFSSTQLVSNRGAVIGIDGPAKTSTSEKTFLNALTKVRRICCDSMYCGVVVSEIGRASCRESECSLEVGVAAAHEGG